MFNSIVFATCNRNACAPAARMAFDIAQRDDAHVYIFHVLGVPTHGYSQSVMDLTTGEVIALDQNYYDLVKEEITSYCDRLLKKTKKYSVEITVGCPHREILRFARQVNPDLIVMGGSTGSSDIVVYKKSITGSTLQRVAKVSPCPVMVVSRPLTSSWKDFSKVVLAVDFSPAADASFDFALRVARELGCELHLFQALDPACTALAPSSSPAEIESGLQEIERHYTPRLGTFKPYTVAARPGMLSQEIVKYAAQKKADLIVLPYTPPPIDTGAPPIYLVESVAAAAHCPVVSLTSWAGRP